jgi:hypothetical protein
MPIHPPAPSHLASRLASFALFVAAFSAASTAVAQAPAAAGAASQPAASADALRPEVAKPLQPVAGLIGEGKAREALAKVAEAEAVGNLSPYEVMIIQTRRAAAAQAAGDTPLLMKSLEAALLTGKVAPEDEVGLVEALVGIASRERDHARVLRWSQRYIDLKGPSDLVRLMRIQSQMLGGDEAGALAALNERVAANDKAGVATPELQLRWLVILQRNAKSAAASATLERLATQHPRPEYWADLVGDAIRRTSGNERAQVELYRLLRATGGLTTAGLRDGLAQTTLRAGQPAEALSVIDEGFAAGVLGTGADAAQHQKLRDQARKQAASDVADRPAAEAAALRAADGNALVALGWSMVAALPAGAAPAAAEPGLALIEQGIAKGGLRRVSEAQLHLGVAQLAAGRKDAARKTLLVLAAESGSDPLAEPIRLWSMWARTPAMLPPS